MPPTTAENLRAWLVHRLATLLSIDSGGIDARERFSRYGLTSLGAGQLVAELSQVVGRPLSPTLVWEAPTIEAVVKHLTGASEAVAAQAEPSRAGGAREPIAIVGVACRFPGAPDPDAFWRLLRDGVDAITEVPRNRWDADAIFDADTTAPGKVNTRWGGFIDQVDRFDPQFFGISPREAVQMDPQQRLTLELAWEALDDAGMPPPGLVESRTGVFVGALFTDYARLQDRAGPEAITTHTSTGSAACILANRVSYALGLEGPSLTLDTACSSSLVAVHLACQSLRSGETDAALAGGVNLMLVPETTMGFSRLGAMSPDGRSRAFGAGANGYVRSEGAGMVVLKRLSDALRGGDPIYAVVRGSAVNNDGASNGLTAPNPRAQQAVLRDACRNAGLAPSDVHYVEAHGTGTPLGDPIEAAGLGAIYGAAHAAGEPLLIGSAKTNVGHLEAAAGIVGIIKVALAMKHDLLPASLHCEEPNPRIDLPGLHLQVVTTSRPWPAPESAPRRAGISSFGYGGTNGHVILESLPRSTMGALRPSRAQNVEDAPAPARAAWIFSGQGSQWIGMGRGLVLSEPAFRAALARCDRALQPLLGWSIFDEILAGAPRAVPDRIDVMWPVIFALQVSLAELLRALGAAPAAVMGHSIGEVAAAHVAGALSLDDAARVIAGQARLVQRKVGRGSMLLAAVGWDEAQTLSTASEGRVHCAIAASPVATVLSGDPMALDALFATLAARGTFVRAVNTGAPVHGPEMTFLGDELPGLLTAIHPRKAELRIVSALTGEPVRGEDLDATYWSRQLREPVRFAQGTARLLSDGYETLVEISPHPIVKQSIEETIRHLGLASSATAVATLYRGGDEPRTLREALDVLAQRGATGAEPGVDRVLVLPVSGQVEGARSEAAARLAELVERTEDRSLDDLCYTASVRRPHHRARGVVVARGRGELTDGLRALAEGREHGAVRVGMAPIGEAPKLAFVFSGQGSQWVGMGRQLLAEEPVFRAKLEECDALLRQHVPWSLLDELGAPEERSRLGETEVVQPALFAIQVGIAELLRAWGVTPDAVIGHSVGEVAAAHVAGALALADAVRLVAWRGRIMQKATGQGKMVWVQLAREEAVKAIAGREAVLAVAAVNDPGSVVLSGETAALDEVVTALSSRGIECRALKVNYAFHSPQMDPLVRELKETLGSVAANHAALALYSTVTGAAVEGEALDAGYWGQNVRQPVQFAPAVAAAFADAHRLFLEVGPHPVLSANTAQCLAAYREEGHAIFTLKRQSDERSALLAAVGGLFARGLDVDWSRLHPEGGRCVSLPTYPWQRERYWIEGVRSEPVKTAPRDPLDDCVYEVQWQRKERAAPAGAPQRGVWLVFADRGNLGRNLVARLAARGQTAVRVISGRRFARVEPDLYEIDPARAEDYVALLREAFGKDRPCRGVVHLPSLNATPWEQATAEALESEQKTVFSSALRAVQAILRTTWRDKPRLWLVTRGAQAVDREPVTGVAQATLWGLGRTIALEHPELDCTLVDLDQGRGAEGANELLEEISAPDADTQIALRAAGRYVARLVRSRFDAAPTSDFHFEESASYLVTGGLGGLGLSAAGWMVDQGARHLALVGRRAPTEEAEAAIRAMEAKGAEVLVLSADVSKRSDVERVVAEIAQRMPALRGVLHAAGIVREPTMVLQLDEDSFWPVMAPKMLGAFHLHAATRGAPLDFFTLYSSASAALGLIGQAAYAAANAILDAVAQGRCGAGLAGQSVLWGPFLDAGLAARGGLGERMGRGGLASLTPEQGCAALGRLLTRPRAQVAVMSLSIRQWLDVFPQLAGNPFWSELGKEEAGFQAAAPTAGRFRQSLDAAAPAERLGLLEQHLREQAGEVLRIDAARIERLAPFKSLGVDSLLSLEVRNRLEASLGLRLSPTLLFTYANVAVLAEYILQSVAPVSEGDTIEAPAATAEDLDPAAGDDDLLAAFDASARRIKKGFLS